MSDSCWKLLSRLPESIRFLSLSEQPSEHLPVDALFHRGRQFKGETLDLDPPNGEKLPARRSRIEWRLLGMGHGAKEISLLLPVEAAPVRTRGKIVTVWSGSIHDPVGVRRQPGFLSDLPPQRLIQGFTLIHTALRELPALRVIGALSYKHAAVCELQDGGHVGSVALVHGSGILRTPSAARKRGLHCQTCRAR